MKFDKNGVYRIVTTGGTEHIGKYRSKGREYVGKDAAREYAHFHLLQAPTESNAHQVAPLVDGDLSRMVKVFLDSIAVSHYLGKHDPVETDEGGEE